MSLACFWRSQGTRQSAADLVAPVCDGCPKELDTSALEEARRWQEALEENTNVPTSR